MSVSPWLKCELLICAGQDASRRDPADPPAESALQRSRGGRDRDPRCQRQGFFTE